MKMANQSLTNESIYLVRNSVEARSALETGFIGTMNGKVPVRAADLIRRASGEEEILFRHRPYVEAKHFGESLGRFLIAIRAFSLTATLMPCLAVLASGILAGFLPRTAVAISAIIGALLLQIAVNLLNDISDYVKLIDLPGSPGGSGVFEKGWYSPGEIRRIAQFALALGFLAGVPALVAYPLQILGIGALGTLGAVLYSHDRIGLKYHALGDLAVFILCGPALTVGFSVATYGELVPGVLPIGAVLGLLACALLHVNNLHDMDLDRSRGASTLASRIGYIPSARLLAVMYGGATLILGLSVYSGALPVSALLAVFAMIPALKLTRRIFAALGPTSPSLEGARMVAAQIHLVAGVLLTLGILSARFFKGTVF